MDKLRMQSHDVIGSNTSKIAQLFPHCVTERLGKDGKPELAIDFEKLQAELSDEIIGDSEERYQFTWPDKRAAVRLANTPTTMTLRPCREESVDFDNTQNLYIEGDNLDVLKVLRETYLGKVKMIYIDPPYNTGNDFVYNDDFAQGKEEFEQASGLFDEEGNQTIDPMQRNTESNGRFHTDWLNMIYPRLKVARDLLADDGVIFVSIDDNEVENLKQICNEIFGRHSFLVEFPRVTKKGGKSTETYAKNHDYVIAFCKNFTEVRISGIAHNDLGFKFKDEFYEERGAYKLNQTLDYNTLGYVNSLDYPISIDGKNFYAGGVSEDEFLARKRLNPKDGYRWRWSKELFEYGHKNGWIVVSNTGRIYTKTYLKATIEKVNNNYCIVYSERTKPITTLDFTDNEYSNDNSNKEITSTIGKSIFDYVKPTSLIQLLSKSITCQDKDSIILDFFSGSATTAHAVMKLNAEDGGNRKFIMVQLSEKTDEKSEAYKAGYKNICEIGKERIRRAGKKIKEEVGLQAQNLDTGFRVLKLDSSNMEDVYYTPGEFELQSLFMENVKPDRTSEDLLFQVMLDLGVELSAQIKNEKLKIKDGRTITVYNVDEGYLMATFDRDIDEATITEIAKRQPVYFVMRDASAASDNVIDNFEQIFRHYSPDTNCRII